MARVSTLVVGSIRLTTIHVGEMPALLLGPLTVDPAFRSKGIAQRLIETALAAAEAQGHRAVLLVGDEAYYSRVGFKPAPGAVRMPGPVDPRRVLVRTIGPGPDAPLSGLFLFETKKAPSQGPFRSEGLAISGSGPCP